MEKIDWNTTLFVVGSLSTIFQYILLKTIDSKEYEQFGSYYKIISHLKNHCGIRGKLIFSLFWLAIVCLIVTGLLSIH